MLGRGCLYCICTQRHGIHYVTAVALACPRKSGSAKLDIGHLTQVGSIVPRHGRHRCRILIYLLFEVGVKATTSRTEHRTAAIEHLAGEIIARGGSRLVDLTDDFIVIGGIVAFFKERDRQSAKDMTSEFLGGNTIPVNHRAVGVGAMRIGPIELRSKVVHMFAAYPRYRVGIYCAVLPVTGFADQAFISVSVRSRKPVRLFHSIECSTCRSDTESHVWFDVVDDVIGHLHQLIDVVATPVADAHCSAIILIRLVVTPVIGA